MPESKCPNCLSLLLKDERIKKRAYCSRTCKDIFELKEQVKILTKIVMKGEVHS